VDSWQLLNKAEKLLLDGAEEEAIILCRTVLDASPCHVEALYLLGVASVNRQQWESAIDCFRKASACADGLPVLLNNLGLALLEGSRQTPPVPGATLEEAAACLQKALQIQP